jgi:lipopolysaccharide transport system permease protein/teichoic acid transport system permease protein
VGGVAWAVLQPLSTVLIYWLVFDLGFKVQGPDRVPFLAYFLCGLVPWLAFSEVLVTSTTAISNNKHLVKKVVFPTEVLPVVNVAAAATTHVVLLVATILVAACYGRAFGLPLLTLVFYASALAAFSLGLAWALAALQVFFRDLAQIVTVVLSLWFWLTPIAWVTDMIPAHLRWIVDLNPANYVVAGYRDAILYDSFGAGLVERTLYFWIVTGSFLCLGSALFRRLKPHFADVL